MTRAEWDLLAKGIALLDAEARAANVTPDLLRRLLRANRVVLLRVGRAIYVPLSEIETHVPPLWESIKAAEMLRRAE